MSDETEPRVIPPKSNDDVCDEETCIRYHDQAMIDWLRLMKIRGRPAKAVTAWRSRFYSQQSDMHDNARAKEPLPLPCIALTALGVTPEPDRWTRSPVRMHGPGPTTLQNTPYTSPDRKAVWHAPFPTPYGFDYQVDIEAKTAQDLRILRTQVMLSWSGHPKETFLVVEFPAYGKKSLALEWLSDQSTSDLETDEQERELRHTFTFRLHGWLFRKADEVPTIQKAHIALIEGDQDKWYCSLDHMHFTTTPEGRTKLTSIDENPATTPPDRVLSLFSFDEDGLVP